MTLEEKISQLHSDGHAIERLDIPRYDWLSKCLHGVAFAGIATVFPQSRSNNEKESLYCAVCFELTLCNWMQCRLLFSKRENQERPSIDPFYAKYTNAYDEDHTHGIPIVAIAEIPDEYMLKMREVVNMLLRKRPDVRAIMVAQSYSIAMRIKESDYIPRRNFQTPQEISEHYTGISDFCPLEEFLHAMIVCFIQ